MWLKSLTQLIQGGADGSCEFEMAVKLSVLKILDWNKFLNVKLK